MIIKIEITIMMMMMMIASIKVGDHYVQPTTVVKDFGVTLDSGTVTSLLFPISTTPVALFRVRFILLAESFFLINHYQW